MEIRRPAAGTGFFGSPSTPAPTVGTGVGEDGEQGLRWVYGTKLKQIRSAPLALGCSKRCIYSNLGCISSKTFIVRSNFHFFFIV